MRSLFVLLLLMNASYLAWGLAFSEKQPVENKVSKSLPQIQGQQKLVLLSELRNRRTVSHQQRVSSNEADASVVRLDKNLVPIMTPAKTCYSLGPILDEKVSKKLAQRLRQVGFTSSYKTIRDRVPKSYWVYFLPEKTSAAAKAILNQLQNAKLEDYFLIRKGKYTHAISMGLYSSYDRAKNRAKHLKELGFKPKIQTRYREVTRYWLNFQETDSQRLNTHVWENAQRSSPLQKLARPCVDPKPDAKS